jgi:glycosyltransferase involved in cell wall biosynthesis
MYLEGLRCLERVPTVWTLHNVIAHDAVEVNYERRMVQALIDRCRGVMVMSHSAEFELRRQYQIPSRLDIRMIPHGHYIDWYPNTIRRNDARDLLHIGQDETVYICMGSLRPYKGQLELIRAFTKVALRNERLVIAGSAADQQYAKILTAAVSETKYDCKGQIDLHTRVVGDDEAQIFFNAADICVLPYTNILNSGSLMLSLSFGKPVVAPRIGSIPEVAHPAAYTAYDSSDSSGLAGAIEAARNSHAHSAYASAEEIRRFARSSYDWSKIGGQLVEWYRDILASSSAKRKLPHDSVRSLLSIRT